MIVTTGEEEVLVRPSEANLIFQSSGGGPVCPNNRECLEAGICVIGRDGIVKEAVSGGGKGFIGLKP